ncbi:MAG: hypothetical protein AAF433_21495 [Bacteroidota bacterium]
MDTNFRAAGPLSALALEHGYSSWSTLTEALRHLPYARTSDRGKLELVLLENRGTCSSKHALAYAIAQEQGWTEWRLMLGMYRMKETNTPGVGAVLAATSLDFIPEAHCYLARGEERLDVTKPSSNFAQLAADIMEEVVIEAEQVGEWKVNFHRAYLRKWIKKEKELALSFEEIWQLRENCILALS